MQKGTEVGWKPLGWAGRLPFQEAEVGVTVGSRSGRMSRAVEVWPVKQLTALEPQLDLSLRSLHRVAGVDDIPVTEDR